MAERLDCSLYSARSISCLLLNIVEANHLEWATVHRGKMCDGSDDTPASSPDSQAVDPGQDDSAAPHFNELAFRFLTCQTFTCPLHIWAGRGIHSEDICAPGSSGPSLAQSNSAEDIEQHQNDQHQPKNPDTSTGSPSAISVIAASAAKCEQQYDNQHDQ